VARIRWKEFYDLRCQSHSCIERSCASLHQGGHAERVIKVNSDVAMASRILARRYYRLRERKDEEGEEQQATQEHQVVFEFPPGGCHFAYLPECARIGEKYARRPSKIEEMDQNRDCEGGQRPQE